MRIHINRNRQSLGQFSPEEVADGLKTGELRPTDLGWQEPMETWKPLAEFTDLPEPTVTAEPPPVPEPLPVAAAEPVWERREELGAFKALRETITQIVSTPSQVFSSLSQESSLRNPLLFFLFVWTFCSWIAGLYNIAVLMVNPEMVFPGAAHKFSHHQLVIFAIAAQALVPFIALIMPFILGGIFHISVTVLCGGERSFATTFRVFCYSWGTASLLKVVPACGPYLYLVMALILMIFGLQKAYKVDAARAAIASMVPLMLLCGALALLLSLSGAALEAVK